MKAQSEAPSVDTLLWELFPCKAPSKCGWALNGNCMCGQSNKRTQAKAKINRLILEARIDEIKYLCGYSEEYARDEDGYPMYYIDMRAEDIDKRLEELNNNLSKGDV